MWRYRQLITDLGGALAVFHLLQKYRVDTAGYSAVRNWSSRNSIPANMLAAIFVCAERDNRELNLWDYLEDDLSPLITDDKDIF